jgi:hypothetical protein
LLGWLHFIEVGIANRWALIRCFHLFVSISKLVAEAEGKKILQE